MLHSLCLVVLLDCVLLIGPPVEMSACISCFSGLDCIFDLRLIITKTKQREREKGCVSTKFKSDLKHSQTHLEIPPNWIQIPPLPSSFPSLHSNKIGKISNVYSGSNKQAANVKQDDFKAEKIILFKNTN